jgi:HD-GYP domain-containing protein (c-di-GMP phosphodiesterase class II)
MTSQAVEIARVRKPTARATSFVLFVLALSLVVSLYVWTLEPAVPASAVKAIVLLGVLALMGDAWQFVLPRSALASIAFIPYTAMVLVVPHWIALVAIATAKLIESCLARRHPVKSAFNVAQFVTMYGAAIMLFRAAGGTAFIQPDGSVVSFANMTSRNGFAAFGAFALAFAVNMVLVSTVIALQAGRRVEEVWRENHLPGIALDLLAAPIVFLFAWVYAAWGPIAAALTWVPILAYRHTMKTTVDLEQTNRELLELMIKSIEARDPYTSGHSRRVQQYAVLIARALGLPEREVEHVGTSALLHDVGKIHEKYGKILTKEDKLTPDEWALMKDPLDGAELVATMTRLQQFVAPVRHHHENWNGTGYPDGLAGDLIPLASRIIMFADTIDAMTTARPYRGPLSEEVVRAEIVRRRGEQFDPTISDAILSSPVWSQLFVPAHPSVQRNEIRLAAKSSSDFTFPGKRVARHITKRVANDP